MKYTFLLLSILFYLPTYSQTAPTTEKEAVKSVLDLFFESVNEQDTTKFKQAMDLNGHLYVFSEVTTPSKYGVDSFQNALKRLQSPRKAKETPLGFDIKIRKGMATAWVPYTFEVNGSFSHCGANSFTLMKQGDIWKIVNVSFTMEKGDCP